MTAPPRRFTAALAHAGYWFCRSCERVTEPEGDIHRRCGHPHCRSTALEYCAPVPRAERPVTKTSWQ